jgi:hypothetical protein
VALLLARPILAADLGPSTRLILAAIVAEYSPQVGTAMNQQLSRLAAGDLSKVDTDTKTEADNDFAVSTEASSAAPARST